MNSPETKDQLIYPVNGRTKAIIDVELTQEDGESPPIQHCRHAALTIKNTDVHGKDYLGYVVYDRLLCRIVNGVFMHLEDALGVALSYNSHPDSPQDMAPNGLALGLIYPPEEER